MRILRAYSALKTFSVSILAASLLAFSGAATIPAQAADNPASPPHNGRHIGNMQGVPVEITLNDVTVANGLTTVNFTIRDLRSSGDGKLISPPCLMAALMPLKMTVREEKKGKANPSGQMASP